MTKDRQTREWAMILHFSQLAGLVIPVAGWLAPILIWQLKKQDLPGLDEHGKIVANWLISALIYLAICIVLILAIVGIPLLIALGILSIVYPIVGGIKANNGETWKYPLSFDFF